MRKRHSPGRLTTRPILPDLIEVVGLFDEGIHYRDAADLLFSAGVWGGTLPPTPAATVNAYLTTARDTTGELIFQRVEPATYAVRSRVRAAMHHDLIA